MILSVKGINVDAGTNCWVSAGRLLRSVELNQMQSTYQMLPAGSEEILQILDQGLHPVHQVDLRFAVSFSRRNISKREPFFDILKFIGLPLFC